MSTPTSQTPERDEAELAADCENEAAQLRKNYGRGYEAAQMLLDRAAKALRTRVSAPAPAMGMIVPSVGLPHEYEIGRIIREAVEHDSDKMRFYLTPSVGALAQQIARHIDALRGATPEGSREPDVTYTEWPDAPCPKCGAVLLFEDLHPDQIHNTQECPACGQEYMLTVMMRVIPFGTPHQTPATPELVTVARAYIEHHGKQTVPFEPFDMCGSCGRKWGECDPDCYVQRFVNALGGDAAHQTPAIEPTAALRAAAEKALAFFEANASQTSYGYALPEDPRDFHPDAECCTPAEIEAHRLACEAWDAAEGKPEGWDRPDTGGWNEERTAHVLKAPWGIGTSTFTDPELAALRDELSAALVVAGAAPEQLGVGFYVLDGKIITKPEDPAQIEADEEEGI